MSSEDEESCIAFHETGIDDRILEAIARMRWETPTPIQEKAIPYFLEGKDILARARTGSGKTGAFLVPLTHRILYEKANDKEQAIKALVLAPSKELCKQTTDILKQLTVLCKREVKVMDVSPRVPYEAQKPLLEDKPDIVVGTPLRVLGHLNEKNMVLRHSLRYLIIDEADLLFTFNHEKEIQAILKKLPSIYQTFVTSATISEDVKKLKKLVLHNPVVLKLEEPPLPTTAQLTQYVIKLEELDKVVLLQVLFTMNILRGKTIIFVNSVDKSYKLRMFLGQFGIRSCILNSEMPITSRCHVVSEFNLGKYDIIIASDEQNSSEPHLKSEDKGKRKKDKESGIARGIDFQYISNIINLDFPSTVDNYIHRVGRTARGNNSGTALSLISSKEFPTFELVQAELRELMSESHEVFQNFKFNLDQLDGFRYRARDAWKRCTSIAVKDVRMSELKSEILNSSKLDRFFEEHPKDKDVLRHDISSKGLPAQPHLKNIPEYNVPQALKRTNTTFRKKRVNNDNIFVVKDKGSRKNRNKRLNTKNKKKTDDPLRTLKFSGFKKKIAK